MPPESLTSLLDAPRITFPFAPWAHQREALAALSAGKNAVLVWHRRAGKDLTLWNFCITQAVKRAGTYFVLFPTYAQSKKTYWDGMTTEGLPYRAFIPESLVLEMNEAEMQIKIRTVDGRFSILQMIGTDHLDRIIGPNPLGAIYSEYSLHNPRVKALLDPIFAANHGWQAFAYTPRGRNHGYQLYEYAKAHPEAWYCSRLTIRDTRKADGTAIIEEAHVDTLRAQGQDEMLLQQEYYCDFEGAVEGAYYGAQLRDLRLSGRIAAFPYVPGKPVRTAWDLGVNDTTVIWFYQKIGIDVRIISHYEHSDVGAEHYVDVLAQQPWAHAYELHLLPHDVGHREWGSGKTKIALLTEQITQKLRPACRHVRLVPRTSSVNDSIACVRRLFPRLQFHEPACEDGLGALAFYHKEYDEQNQVYRNKPSHDWSSNSSDAIRTLADGESYTDSTLVQTRAFSAWDPFDERQAEAQWQEPEPFAPVLDEQRVEALR